MDANPYYSQARSFYLENKSLDYVAETQGQTLPQAAILRFTPSLFLKTKHFLKKAFPTLPKRDLEASTQEIAAILVNPEPPEDKHYKQLQACFQGLGINHHSLESFYNSLPANLILTSKFSQSTIERFLSICTADIEMLVLNSCTQGGLPLDPDSRTNLREKLKAFAREYYAEKTAADKSLPDELYQRVWQKAQQKLVCEDACKELYQSCWEDSHRKLVNLGVDPQLVGTDVYAPVANSLITQTLLSEGNSSLQEKYENDCRNLIAEYFSDVGNEYDINPAHQIELEELLLNYPLDANSFENIDPNQQVTLGESEASPELKKLIIETLAKKLAPSPEKAKVILAQTLTHLANYSESLKKEFGEGKIDDKQYQSKMEAKLAFLEMDRLINFLSGYSQAAEFFNKTYPQFLFLKTLEHLGRSYEDNENAYINSYAPSNRAEAITSTVKEQLRPITTHLKGLVSQWFKKVHTNVQSEVEAIAKIFKRCAPYELPSPDSSSPSSSSNSDDELFLTRD